MSYRDFFMRSVAVTSERLIERLKPDATLSPLLVGERWRIDNYRQLLRVVGALSFFNQGHILLFRGQTKDFEGQLSI